MLDNLTDEELALYCALTGQTAEQLDKEEAEFKKALLAKPEVFEEHVEDFLKNHPEPKEDRELWWRIYVGSEIAKQRLMRGSLTATSASWRLRGMEVLLAVGGQLGLGLPNGLGFGEVSLLELSRGEQGVGAQKSGF